jgi:hypothetical protein
LLLLRRLARYLQLYQLIFVIDNKLDPVNNATSVPAEMSCAVLFDCEAFSDFTFRHSCGNNVIHLHRVILAARAPLLMQGHNRANEATPESMRIDSQEHVNTSSRKHMHSFDAYLFFFQHLYSDALPSQSPAFTVPVALETLALALDYGVGRLCALLVQYLARSIDYMNSVSMLMFVRAHHHSPHNIPDCEHALQAFEVFVVTWIGYRVRIMRKHEEWRRLSKQEREAVLAIEKPGYWVEQGDAHNTENCSVS